MYRTNKTRQGESPGSESSPTQKGTNSNSTSNHNNNSSSSTTTTPELMSPGSAATTASSTSSTENAIPQSNNGLDGWKTGRPSAASSSSSAAAAAAMGAGMGFGMGGGGGHPALQSHNASNIMGPNSNLMHSNIVGGE